MESGLAGEKESAREGLMTKPNPIHILIIAGRKLTRPENIQSRNANASKLLCTEAVNKT